MKYPVLALLASLCLSLSARAATPEQEKAFLDSYKTAVETGDKKTLTSFLYTVGAPADIVEFFKMMVTMPLPPDSKITSVELVKPTPEEAAKLNEPQTMPDGKKFKLPLEPYKQLVVTVESKGASGSGKGTSKMPVAEKDGKIVIPVPVPAK